MWKLNEEESKTFLTYIERFNDLFLEATDKVLRDVLGEHATNIIYEYMEKFSRLKREDIAEKYEIFLAELKKLLGSGETLIERLVLRSLYSKLGLEFNEKENYTFSDHIEELRKRFVRGQSPSIILQNRDKHSDL